MQDEDSVTDLAVRLRAVIGRLGRRLNASAAGQGLTSTQASALAVIAPRSPLGIGQLTALEGLNPTMASRIVSKLEELDLVRRVQNENDLRSISVEITERGQEINDEIRLARARVVAQCLAGMSTQSRAALLDALPVLEEFAEALWRQEDPAG